MVNLSDKEIPDIVYIYLSCGLNFVQAKVANKEDLKFDLQEFLRKLSWKAYFHLNPDQKSTSNTEGDLHADLKVKSKNYPIMSNPLLDEVKDKVLGWVANFNPKQPQSNLSPQAIRGRRWILNAVTNRELFVTRADKGGAILILNYETVKKTLEDELFDPAKYEVVSEDADSHLKNVNKRVKDKVLDLEARGLITGKDREIITGLNEKHNQTHNPEYRPEDPKIYPLFKLHKLDSEQIENKTTPPARFVNNSKFGPLYRVEKWISPFITKISRAYSADEYLRDADHLISEIKEYNNTLTEIPKNKRPKFLLATLDVKALYPSIRPSEAMLALSTAVDLDTTTPSHTKTAVLEISQMILDEAYVRYQNKCYKPLIGIATGGCNSRQTADCVLHRLVELVKTDIPLWKFIKLLKRFIDDLFLIWVGTKRQFSQLVQKLNSLTSEYGIIFGDYSVGTSVDFLDLRLFVNDEGLIGYILFQKPTDSRLYLRTGSFHPPHVFNSVAFSQMLRVWKRNSTISHANKDIEDLKNDLEKCGHNRTTLDELHEKLKIKMTHTTMSTAKSKPENVLVAVVDYFKEFDELKTLLKDIKPDIYQLIGGNVEVLVAARRGASIGSQVVKNRQLCELPTEDISTQKCGAGKCQCCPSMCNMGDKFNINGMTVVVKKKLNCKSKNVIYLGQCQLCDWVFSDNTYTGQTVSEFHNRVNGHRSCFAYVKNEPDKIDLVKAEKSALALHSSIQHSKNFNLNNFKFILHDQARPRDLNRREARHIGELRTNVMGLNRMNVQN